MSRVISGSAPAVPVNTGAPAFSGTPTVGQTLTGTNGTWTNSPTGYTYQHQSSPDGVGSWSDISGATSQNLLLGSGELGEYVRPGVRASNGAGPAASFAYGSAVGPVAAASAELAPSGTWNGTIDSGGSPYTDPTRTGPKCALRPLVPYGDTIGLRVWSGSNKLWFDAQAFGGIQQLNIKAEGGTPVVLTSPQNVTYTDSNGVSRDLYCYEVGVNVAAFLAVTGTGTARVSVEAVANDPTIQNRVFNITIRPRATEYGQTKTVKASGGDYTTIDAALAYARTQAEETNIICDSLTQNIVGGATYANSPRWITISHAPGATVNIGDGTLIRTQCAFDGLWFKGNGIKWDVSKVGYSISSWRMTSGCTRLVLDGVDFFCGTATGTGGSGSGSAALYNYTLPAGYFFSSTDNFTTWTLCFLDVEAHDLPAYGLSFHQLRRNSSVSIVSGSDNECVTGAVIGGYTNRCGGYSSGLMTATGAFDIINAGPATWQFARTNNNGLNGNAELYKNGAGSPTYTLAVTSNTPMTDVINWINGLGEAGLSAVATTTTNQLGAAHMTLTGLARAAPIPKTSVGSSLSVLRVADIHADVIVWHGGPPSMAGYENVLITRFEGRMGEECAYISNNGDQPLSDVFLTNLSFQYDSALTGGQPGYDNGAHSHMVIQNVTNCNPYGKTIKGTFDSYCAYSRYAGTIAWSGSQSPIPAANLQLLDLFCRQASAITGADANSKASNIAVTAMVTDVTSSIPDFTPLSPLQLADSTWAGRYLPTGAEQDSN